MSLLISNFRKTVAKDKDKRMSTEAEFGVGYPTGFLCFDFMNGVKVKVEPLEGQPFTYNSIGVVDGSMISCVGRSGCGKTTFVMQSAGKIVKPFPNSAIFNESIEAGISGMRARQLLQMNEEEFNTKYIERNTGITTENFYERIKIIHDIKLENREDYEYDTGYVDSRGNRVTKLQPTVIILDSLAMLMPADMALADELAGPMGAAAIARQNTQLVKRVIPMLKMANIIWFVISHILPDPSPIPKKSQTAWLKVGERVSGGETAIYLANNFLRFDDKSKLTAEKDFGINGIYVDIQFIKSRTSNAGQVVNMVFDYDNGFDPDLSMYMMLSAKGFINGSGASTYLGDRTDLKFTKKTFKQKITTDEEFRNYYIELCQQLLEGLINNSAINSIEQNSTTVDTTSILLSLQNIS